jgi:predicted restriction endonuclease
VEDFVGRAEVLKARQLVQRFVRDSAMARRVKKLYDYRCQLGCDPLTTST